MNTVNKRLLFVDDEPQLLNAMRRMLHRRRGVWDMHFCAAPGEALALMARLRVDVIVSDMRMPDMDGVQLLKEVSRVSPGTVRIVLSGQASEQPGADLVHYAHQFLAKPCEAENLIATLERACTLHDLLAPPRMQALVGRLETLPSIPHLYQELRRELASGDTSVSRVGAIVARDPAMAGKILQLVNSAFFALPRRVSNPVEAVTLLGLESIGNLALVAGIFHQFDSALYREFQLQGLWQQALVTGVIARAIATDEGFPLVRREAAATAGLLSDLGLLVLVGAQPDLYRAILARMRDRGETPVQAQRQVLGTDQARIGAYLLGVWGLPNEVILAVAYHQDLDAEPGRDLSPACIVHVAHALARDPAASTDDSVGLNLAAFEQRGIAGRLAQWRGCAAAATLPRDKPL